MKAYYTKGWEKLDDVARKYDMDPKDLLAWNKPSLPALTQKAYLIEHTRLWLGPPPESPPGDRARGSRGGASEGIRGTRGGGCGGAARGHRRREEQGGGRVP